MNLLSILGSETIRNYVRSVVRRLGAPRCALRTRNIQQLGRLTAQTSDSSPHSLRGPFASCWADSAARILSAVLPQSCFMNSDRKTGGTAVGFAIIVAIPAALVIWGQ